MKRQSAVLVAVEDIESPELGVVKTSGRSLMAGEMAHRISEPVAVGSSRRIDAVRSVEVPSM